MREETEAKEEAMMFEVQSEESFLKFLDLEPSDFPFPSLETTDVPDWQSLPSPFEVQLAAKPEVLSPPSVSSPDSESQLSCAPKPSLKRPRDTGITTAQMGGLSSEDFDRILQERALSPEEERHVKRQRRLIKNRESAQKSRTRRKLYIDELEQKISDLVAQNEQLAKENKTLKDEVSTLRGTFKPDQSQTLSLQPVKQLQYDRKQLQPSVSANAKTAGLCLLIMLFSFGLFFNFNERSGGMPALPFEREPVPEVLLHSQQERYTARLLKSLKDFEFVGSKQLEIQKKKAFSGPTRTTVEDESFVQNDQGQHHEQRADTDMDYLSDADEVEMEPGGTRRINISLAA